MGGGAMSNPMGDLVSEQGSPLWTFAVILGNTVFVVVVSVKCFSAAVSPVERLQVLHTILQQWHVYFSTSSPLLYCTARKCLESSLNDQQFSFSNGLPFLVTSPHPLCEV